MQLSVGIVGLPNVGKSTLFNALTRSSVPAENYPFCTIDPSVGVVAVPDPRLETLSKISGSEKIIPAIVEFVDIAGLVKGAASGEGLGNKFLQNIREVSMIAEVVRIFEDGDIHHVAGMVDPMSDIEVINLELIMADTETVSRRLSNVERDAKRGDKDSVKEKEVLEALLAHLQDGKLANSLDLSDDEKKLVKNLHLLTMKQFLYVCNRKQDSFNLDEQNDERWQRLVEFFEETGSEYVVVDAGMEHDLKDLEEDEKTEFRREYGAQDSGVESLIRACYHRLGLMSYFTTGEKETRAWTVEQGSTGPEAGSAIHTDFRDKYIRAQVVSFADLVVAGSIPKARETGKLRTEGKEYIVQDGDVIEFMHS
ncbi:redox-regulated ATPase YchF [Candidatus Kaiserbacteria bacterium RIFCSPHIGHO2_01_FULL_46_22]|uniref:Ribosome-binding ATPase YchF n=1 Tax=Candidatus Kaiserbacteria bacterium RIFCSPHIGHO2_01_FULL_46_22 TaxID=1798475 RepID=A0A1F6BY37_9BACT|nr:MAG: redox-regulated ATPase YchF [Candidatus Kaiserbacteria bacterium RIFCSPHIGHO2_01_FULL_46_22]